MHYVPESAREFLPDPEESRSPSESAFHYQSLPIYVLTVLVGSLLAADWLIGRMESDIWQPRQLLFGYRLALIAALLGGSRILYQTLESLLNGRVGADLALALAAFAAILLGEHETAALVVLIALVGESIEGYTVDRARRAVRGAFQLCPPVAHVVREEEEQTVPIGEVRIGDTVVVRSGERIPVDGLVTNGQSTVDESTLTGESVPVDKSINDPIYAGTLNQRGALTIRAERVSGETQVDRIMQLVADAASQKAPLERTADRLARYFLPAVAVAALATLVGWRIASGGWDAGIRPALGVLVVACPCPLVLATPTAMMAAFAWLARHGVVVRGGAALERLASVQTLAFDKTGTLTAGQLSLEGIQPIDPLTADELLRIAAIAEKNSEHLIARQVVTQAESLGFILPAVERFESHPGNGVAAMIRVGSLGETADVIPSTASIDRDQSIAILVGKRHLLDKHGIPPTDQLEQVAEVWEREGQTTFFVAVGQSAIGVIGVRDELRANAANVLRKIKAERDCELALLTGDQPIAAARVGEQLGGIDEVHAGLLPNDKAEWVKARQSGNRRVAMIGDGVNDAPALVQADVGLALAGVGSDLAAEAGDILLLGDPLQPLPGLLKLSQALVRNIRQSIFLFAFGMNALGVVACGWGLLSPAMGAVFHELSSLCVMVNALRLLWFDADPASSPHSTTEPLAATTSSWTERLVDALSPSQLVFRIARHWDIWFKLACAAGILVWLANGIVQIRSDEHAIVTRFGRLHEELTPGLHWRWPVPFETVIRDRIDELRTIPIGYRNDANQKPRSSDEIIEWTSSHGATHAGNVVDEALVLTADQVLVELNAEVQFRISDLRQFRLGVHEPERQLRALAESVLRDVASTAPLESLLTDRRAAIEQRCFEAITTGSEHMHLGVEIVAVSLLDVHPPQPVVPAYRDVANALEEQQRQINEAERYYLSRLTSVVGEQAYRELAAKRDATNDDATLSQQSIIDQPLWDR